MTFDLDKAMKNDGKCQTRDGRLVRIVCIDRIDSRWADEPQPIVGLVIIKENGRESIDSWTINGKDTVNGNNDLTNIPEKKEGWVLKNPTRENILGCPYSAADSNVWISRNESEAVDVGCNCSFDTNKTYKRCKPIKIEWDE